MDDEPIGPLIGEGRTAEIFGYGPGRVAKVLRPGFDAASLEVEAALTRAAHGAGAPAPRVHGRATFDDRPALILEFVDGPSMLEIVFGEPARAEEEAEAAARLHASILSREAGGNVGDLKNRLRRDIAAAELPAAHRIAALARLEELPDGSSLLHGDFHPANIHVTASGSVVIDWVDASRGDPAADIARSSWLVSGAAVGDADPAVLAIAQRYQSAYQHTVTRLMGIDTATVDAWMLPVLAARLSEGVDAEEEALRESVARLAVGKSI